MPGILYSEIVEHFFAANCLTLVMAPSVGRYLRKVQSNVSESQFLKDLTAKAREQDMKGVTASNYFVRDDELHFCPPTLKRTPSTFLEYSTYWKSVLRFFLFLPDRKTPRMPGRRPEPSALTYATRHGLGTQRKTRPRRSARN